MMDSQGRHRRVMALFDEACDLPAARRDAFLRQACGDDATLRREIEVLLMHDAAPLQIVGADSQGGGFEVLAADLAAAPIQAANSTEERVPERIGRYRIIRKLGEGGMGVVFEAEQDYPHRRVALKLIKAAIASPAILRRFEHEAHVLARLHHPGIAQIFEAGAFDFGMGARPFLVMELIHGRPLTDYALANQLATSDTLELVARVCDAVQHAHQKSVIHRDLKPANILVVEEGTEAQRHEGTKAMPIAPALRASPKILDFGVARVIDADLHLTTLQTGIGQVIGTLAYMSPEQLTGDPDEIDTRTDVYALGVILYQLLAGRLPHDIGSRSFPEAMRVIRDETPARLSSINRAFRGDIDTIARKALEKEKERRYASAADFAADIRRFLSDQPILARPATAMYQVRKFVRRNKILVGVGVAATLALVAGTVVSLIYAQKASWARDAALNAEAAADVARRKAEGAATVAEAQTDEARRQAYLANIAAAQAALYLSDVASARKRLNAVPDDDRQNWEWNYLASQLDESSAVWKVRGPSFVFSADVSPDGTTLATAGADEAVRFWDIATGSVRAVWDHQPGSVWPIEYSPDGTLVAFGTSALKARVCRADTGELVYELPGQQIAFNSDGTRLATSDDDGVIRLFEVGATTPLREMVQTKARIRSLAFNRRGDRIVATYQGNPGDVPVFDTATGSLFTVLKGHTSIVNSARFSPDDSLIVTASHDRSIRVWDALSGAQRDVLWGHDAEVRFAAFIADGKGIVSASLDNTLRLWDVERSRQIKVLNGHADGVGHWVSTTDGQTWFSLAADGTIRVWDAMIADRPELLRGHDRMVLGVAFSRDGSRIATASGDKTLRLWDAASGGEIATLSGHTGYVTGVAFTSDAETVISCSYDKTVRTWDARTGEPLATLEGHADRVLCVAVSPDGTTLASGAQGGEIILWKVATKVERTRFRADKQAVRSVVFAPDGHTLYSSGEEPSFRAWNLDTGQLIAENKSHRGAVLVLALSPDGSLLASASEDGTAGIWNARDINDLKRRLVQPQAALSVAFTPDSRRLAVGTYDGTIRLWDVRRGEEVLPMRDEHSPILTMTFNPSGTILATGSLMASLHLWETEPVAVRLKAKREWLMNRIDPISVRSPL